MGDRWDITKICPARAKKDEKNKHFAFQNSFDERSNLWRQFFDAPIIKKLDEAICCNALQGLAYVTNAKKKKFVKYAAAPPRQMMQNFPSSALTKFGAPS